MCILSEDSLFLYNYVALCSLKLLTIGGQGQFLEKCSHRAFLRGRQDMLMHCYAQHNNMRYKPAVIHTFG